MATTLPTVAVNASFDAIVQALEDLTGTSALNGRHDLWTRATGSRRQELELQTLRVPA